jgi:hypothetical protein
MGKKNNLMKNNFKKSLPKTRPSVSNASSVKSTVMRRIYATSN